MNKYYYDLHIHSCLSPCADDDNTPYNIAGMAALAGIQILALTDHNTCRNCPAFFSACKQYGLIPVAGMELTTAEDIHIICLFENLDDAMRFSEHVYGRLPKIPNRVDIYGQQMVLGEDDSLIDTEEYFLSIATDITLDEAPSLVAEFGGICYPAHIDREANGIIATLGTMPPSPRFSVAEFHFSHNVDGYKERYEVPHTTVICSDAHCLTDIRDAENALLLDDEPYSGDRVRHELFKKLKGEI